MKRDLSMRIASSWLPAAAAVSDELSSPARFDKRSSGEHAWWSDSGSVLSRVYEQLLRTFLGRMEPIQRLDLTQNLRLTTTLSKVWGSEQEALSSFSTAGLQIL